MGTGVRSKIDSWRANKASGETQSLANASKEDAVKEGALSSSDNANIDFLILNYRIESVAGGGLKLMAPTQKTEKVAKDLDFIRNNKQKILDRIKEKAESKEKYNKKYDDIISKNRDLIRSLRSVAGSRTVDLVVSDIINKGLSSEKAKKAIRDAIIREKSLRS